MALSSCGPDLLGSCLATGHAKQYPGEMGLPGPHRMRGTVGTDQGQLTGNQRPELHRLRYENHVPKKVKGFSRWRQRTLPGGSCRRMVSLDQYTP